MISQKLTFFVKVGQQCSSSEADFFRLRFTDCCPSSIDSSVVLRVVDLSKLAEVLHLL